MSFDARCHDLAVYFLEDKSEQLQEHSGALAQHIQDAIEAWLEARERGEPFKYVAKPRHSWSVVSFGPLDDDETELSRQEFGEDERAARYEFTRGVQHELQTGCGGGFKLMRDGVCMRRYSRAARNY